MSNLRLDTLRVAVPCTGLRRQRNEPTTGTPNLDFSVADVDAIIEQVRLRNDSIATIADQRDVPVSRILQICSEAGLFAKPDPRANVSNP